MIDKPGTTGETLSVLMHALHGLDYKLRIVLNRADQFTNIHDFARYVNILFNYSLFKINFTSTKSNSCLLLIFFTIWFLWNMDIYLISKKNAYYESF